LDPRGAPIRLLIATALAVLGSASLAADGQRLKALNWTAAGHERAVLLEQPATCHDPAAPRDAAIGEALFNAPALLGGQAERAGLSCAGCHANGRRSAAFFLDGISGEPGTADITSSFFALPRANAVFDPKAIPDLALPGKVSRDPAPLERFLRGLVVDEFAGAEPGPAALTALGAYVRAVRACPGAASEAKSLDSDLRLALGSVEAAIAMIERGEDRTAAVLVKAARFRLGLIDERMAGKRLLPIRRRLLADSRALAAFAGDSTELSAWRERFVRETVPGLVRSEPRSLYNPHEVDRWLVRGRPTGAR
jgi:hypothetical protein